MRYNPDVNFHRVALDCIMREGGALQTGDAPITARIRYAYSVSIEYSVMRWLNLCQKNHLADQGLAKLPWDLT